uniref:Uncharacterized protein n=1 Tax=Timema monikensis TaxID=170555 RepID=A0A7R9E3B9_9NEOP|nr:unnamed protein product [Timema monikensis]
MEEDLQREGIPDIRQLRELGAMTDRLNWRRMLVNIWYCICSAPLSKDSNKLMKCSETPVSQVSVVSLYEAQHEVQCRNIFCENIPALVFLGRMAETDRDNGDEKVLKVESVVFLRVIQEMRVCCNFIESTDLKEDMCDTEYMSGVVELPPSPIDNIIRHKYSDVECTGSEF